MYHVFVHVFTAISKFSFGFWRVCGEGRHVFVFRVLFLNPVKTQFEVQIWSEHHWTAHDCNTVYSEALSFMICTSSSMTSTPSTHHASSILSLLRLHRSSLFGLSLSSHIRPPSLIHHPFSVCSLSIPVIWDCVCWSISGFFLWPWMVIRKAQITVITRFGLILGKAHAKHTSYRECCELLLFNRLLGCSEWLLGHFQAYWLQKHTSIFEDHVRLRP